MPDAGRGKVLQRLWLRIKCFIRWQFPVPCSNRNCKYWNNDPLCRDIRKHYWFPYCFKRQPMEATPCQQE